MNKIVFFVLLLTSSIAYSQKESAFWYFGQYAGLDFNSGSPVVLTDGQLNTFEGCATISDCNGSLLFYTDGIKVWDRQHTIMTNGTGLYGDPSSTQSSIIVPKPNNADIYYVFTVDANPNGSRSGNGIRYSIVDMSLRGGFGDVTLKNNLLPNSLPYAYEKIAVTKHANNTDYWVVTFIEDRFYAWLLDATGINNPPIISSNGITSTRSSVGYLKISPDGSKIGCANYGLNFNNPSMMLYDFDTATGIVSNELQLTLDENDDIPYGVEFSLQSNKLYVVSDKLSSSTGRILPSKLVQFDITVPRANISATRVLIHTSNTNYRGALQLAIDGKIYRARSLSAGITQVGSNWLGIINNPNADGFASNYVDDGIDVSARSTTRKVVEGLPPFIASSFIKPQINATNICLGANTQFTITPPPASVTWDFGEPASGSNNTSTNISPTHTYSSLGTFTVTAQLPCNQTVTYQVIIDASPNVPPVVSLFSTCLDTGNSYNFNLEDANSQISTVSTITYFEDSNLTTPVLTPNSYLTNIDKSVWAKVENGSGCANIAEVQLKFKYNPTFDLPTNITICIGLTPASIQLTNPGAANYTYQWKDSNGNSIPGETNQSLQISTGGNYWVTATNPVTLCETSKTISVSAQPVLPLLNFDSSNLQVTENTYNTNIITVSIANLPISTYEFALDNKPFQTSPIFENVDAGIRTITIKDVENCLEASAKVAIIIVPNFFTPNNDSFNDYWQVTGVSTQPNSKIYIFDRFGKLIKILSPLSQGWDGTYKGNPLPSTDYWYKVELEDGRVLKGHFSLIR